MDRKNLTLDECLTKLQAAMRRYNFSYGKGKITNWQEMRELRGVTARLGCYLTINVTMSDGVLLGINDEAGEPAELYKVVDEYGHSLEILQGHSQARLVKYRK